MKRRKHLTPNGWEIEKNLTDEELFQEFIRLREKQFALLNKHKPLEEDIIRKIDKYKKFHSLLSLIKTIDDNLKADDFEDVLEVIIKRGWKRIITKVRKYY